MSDRNLTEADVIAIVDKLKEEIAKDLFAEAGKGLWTTLRKALFWAALSLAAINLSGGRDLSTLFHTVK